MAIILDEKQQNILSKITLDHTAGDIFQIFEDEGLAVTEKQGDKFFEQLRFFIGPYPGEDFEAGFAFFIATSAHDNNGVYREPLEGYKHLPFRCDEVFDDGCRCLDWYNFGIGEQEDCLQEFSLAADEKELSEHLRQYFEEQVKQLAEHETRGKKGYREKLDKTLEFIMERFVEFRSLVLSMIDDLRKHEKVSLAIDSARKAALAKIGQTRPCKNEPVRPMTIIDPYGIAQKDRKSVVEINGKSEEMTRAQLAELNLPGRAFFGPLKEKERLAVLEGLIQLENLAVMMVSDGHVGLSKVVTDVADLIENLENDRFHAGPMSLKTLIFDYISQLEASQVPPAVKASKKEAAVGEMHPQKPKIECESCGDKHWWCRGCGGQLKMQGLQCLGMALEEADDIYDDQFGPCDTFVPCYICNKDGKLGDDMGPREFWANV